MKNDNNFVTCTRSSDKISKLNKELFNFQPKFPQIILTKQCSLVLVFRKKIVFLQIRVQLKCVQIEKQQSKTSRRSVTKLTITYQLKVSATQFIALLNFGAEEVLGRHVTCDQAFFFFFKGGRGEREKKRERQKGIIGRGHDLRLGVMTKNFLASEVCSRNS